MSNAKTKDPGKAELTPVGGKLGDGITLHDVKRDAAGRVICGYVVNGAWTLEADHEVGEYWPRERPKSRSPVSQMTGWEV